MLLALPGQILPTAALTPIHGVGQFFSNIGRAYVHRSYLEWTYLWTFFLGSVVGALLVLPLVALMDQVSAGVFRCVHYHRYVACPVAEAISLASNIFGGYYFSYVHAFWCYRSTSHVGGAQ